MSSHPAAARSEIHSQLWEPTRPRADQGDGAEGEEERQSVEEERLAGPDQRDEHPAERGAHETQRQRSDELAQSVRLHQ
jgi:hypothetical protein